MTQVSDHALVRYLERVYGIDMDAIRDGVVTTVVPKRQRHRGRG